MSVASLPEILAPSGSGRRGALSVRTAGSWPPRAEDPTETARPLAAALIGYGLYPGGAVGVLATEGSEALVAQLAVLAAGGVLVPLDPDAGDDRIRDGLARTRAVQAIVSDEIQLARLLAMRPDLPSLGLVLLMTASPSERRKAALLADEAITVGRERLAEDPDLLRRSLGVKDERAPAVLFPADGVGEKAISRAELTKMAGRISDTLGVQSGAAFLVALPVSALARLAASLAALAHGATLCLPAGKDGLDAGLAGLAPQSALLDAVALAHLGEAWNAQIDARGWHARTAIRWALRVGTESQGRPWAMRVAELVALRALRQRLGGKLTRIHVIGPPIHPDTASLFQAIGAPIRPFETRLAR